LSNKALPNKAWPDLPDRSRLSVSLIGRTLSSQKSGEIIALSAVHAPNNRVGSTRPLGSKNCGRIRTLPPRD
jgi:hypothetical protein